MCFNIDISNNDNKIIKNIIGKQIKNIQNFNNCESTVSPNFSPWKTDNKIVINAKYGFHSIYNSLKLSNNSKEP